MEYKKWCVSKIDKELAKELSAECDVDPMVALLASARGYDDPMELEQLLSDEPFFSDFEETADIIIAAELVNDTIDKGLKIAIYGDYDCDGVSATALLYRYLKSRDADCFYYIPDRFTEGYGMNLDAVKEIYNSGAKLIITVDNGIMAIDEIEYAKKLGMSVIVTDHHIPSEVLPCADAIVNPHREDCPSEFKCVCGAEVAFRLICVMDNKQPEELIYNYADILTLAVIADVMPLIQENRSIVKCGINKLRNSPNTGLSAMMSVAGIEKKNIDAGKIAYGISPRINAAGRMGKAERAVELLCCDNMLTALSIANEIDADNSLRQQIEKQIIDQAIENIEKNGYYHNRVIVCEGRGWHRGVVGIVAARIAERYGRPAILISVDEDGTAHGSGRSVLGFSLYNAISACSEHLTKYGGHEQAAGISIDADNIDNFRQQINDYAFSTEFAAPVLQIDCKLNPSALSLDLALAIKRLEPFGSQNPAPVFGLFGVKLERIIPIGNGKHLRLLFSKGENSFSAVCFGVGTDKFCFDIRDVLDLAVTVEVNNYKGESNLSVIIKSIRMNGTDDQKLFEDICAWGDFNSGNPYDAEILLPTREQTGIIYKHICEKPVFAQKLKYHFINSIGYGKTCAALQTLEELKLIEINNNGFIKALASVSKTSLSDAATYKKLLKGDEGND